jgi:hypothetical protein
VNFDDIANNYIGRIVAFVLTPILVPAVTAVAAWAQDAIGINLDGAQLTAYVIAVATGLAVVAATWLRNNGTWEVASAELIKLHELGSQQIADADPTQPPGLTITDSTTGPVR